MEGQQQEPLKQGQVWEWLQQFKATLEEKVPQKKWTDIVHQLCMLGICDPVEAQKDAEEETDDVLLHKARHQELFNQTVMDMLNGYPHLVGKLRQVVKRDLAGPTLHPAGEHAGEYGRIASREWSKWFLQYTDPANQMKSCISQLREALSRLNEERPESSWTTPQYVQDALRRADKFVGKSNG